MKIQFKNKYTKYTLIVLLGIIISLVFEILLFNYPGIRTYFEKNKDVNIDYYILDARYTDIELVEYEKLNLKKGNSTLNDGNNLVFIPNINFPVSSINIYYDRAYDTKITYKPNFTAYGNEYGYYSLDEKVIDANCNNAYISLDTKTNCYTIALYINTTIKDINISNIVLNHANFNILPSRMICIFIVYILGYFIISKKIYKFTTTKNHKLKILSLIIATLVIILFTSYVYVMINIDSLKKLTYTHDEYIHYFETYNAQVKSVVENNDGTFNIDSLFKRETYDMAEYNNRHYYYLNRLPIYLISLPIYTISNLYINVNLINLILMIITIIIAAILYNKITNLFIKDISLFNYILGFITLVLGSNILFARRSYSCDLAFLCNISLLMLGIIFIVSLVKQENKILRMIYSFIIGLISGLLIFSTPLSLIYITLFIILTIALSKKDNKVKICEFLIFILPIILFVILTANYNIKRFNSPFEYGYTYNTLRLDHTYPKKINLGYIITGIVENIVITPNMDLFKFPYFKMDIINNTSFLNEYTYAHNVLGIISFPIIWLLIFKKFLKYYKDDNCNQTLRIINILVIFAFVILFFNIALNGISEIYTLEFKFILMLAALLFIFKYIEKETELKGNTSINKVFLVLTLINLFIIIPISISTDKLYLYMLNIDFVNNIRNLFMFFM